MGRWWSKKKTIDLIALYKRNDVLWNLKNPEYHCKKKKNIVLEEMAREFSCTPKEVQRKLHHLKKKIIYVSNKIKESKTKSNYKNTWPYFSKLKFLLPIITGESKRFKGKNQACTQYSGKTFSLSPQSSTFDDFQMMMKPKDKEASEGSENKKHRAKINETCLENLYPKTTAAEIDENENFGKYVASELRSLRTDFNRRRLKSIIRKDIIRITDEDHLWTPVPDSKPDKPAYFSCE